MIGSRDGDTCDTEVSALRDIDPVARRELCFGIAVIASDLSELSMVSESGPRTMREPF